MSAVTAMGHRGCLGDACVDIDFGKRRHRRSQVNVAYWQLPGQIRVLALGFRLLQVLAYSHFTAGLQFQRYQDINAFIDALCCMRRKRFRCQGQPR